MPRTLIHWIFALAALGSLGCEAGVLSAEQSKYKPVGADLAILKDAAGTLTVDELERPNIAARFVSLTGPPQLGYVKEVVWLRLTLQRQESAPQTWFLEFSNPFINDLRLYSRTASGFTSAQAGDQFAFTDRALKYRFPTFALALPNTQLQTFYLRLDSDSSLAGELKVWQPAAMQDKAQHELFYFGAVLGMIFMSFLISIIHWHLTRERKVFLFAILTANAFLMVATGLGLVAQFLTPTLPVIADLLVPWSLAFNTVLLGVVFGNALNLRADHLRLGQAFKLAYCLAVIAPFTRAFNMYNIWGGPMLQLVSLMVLCGTGWLSWIRWRSKVPGAAYFLAAHVAVLGNFLVNRMNLLGILPANDFTHLSWIPGVLAFIFLVHAGVFVDSQLVKRERDVALGEFKMANEVLLSERKSRAEQAVFFSFVAHELRSPLAAIIIGIKNLENELAEVGPQVLARIRRITGYAERMGSLIDRNLTLQRLASADFLPQFSFANPRQIAEEVVRRVRIVFADCVFAVDYAEGLPTTVFLDQDLLLMGLENLLVNAAKFGPAGGSIGLEVLADSALHFCVSDRGPGIHPDQIGRMFSVFGRMQNPGFKSGFGIGLAIAQRVAHAHGGTLKYADRLDGGAVFTLTIPLASDRSGSTP